MNLKEQLTCKYCNEIYNEPVILNCCSENVCKRHIEEFLSVDNPNKFLCPFCDAENTNQQFSHNKLIQVFIENQLHELELDSNYKGIFNKFKVEIENLETLLKGPDNFVYEEIHELKRLVDLDREKNKSQIDELANGLIEQLEEYEAKFKSDYKNNVDLEQFNALVESSRKKLADYENFFNVFSTKQEERAEKNKQAVEETNSLKSQIIEFKNALFSNLSITYKPMKIKKEDMVGKLLIKV